MRASARKCAVCNWEIAGPGQEVAIDGKTAPVCCDECAEKLRQRQEAGQSISVDADRRAIESHVRGIFDAYFRGDREAIRRAHTRDWKGFMIQSRTLVRGIDDYMSMAEGVLAAFPGVRYEFLEFEVDVRGDLALVYYVAREWLRDPDGCERTVRLRSIDVYRREPDGWNQCGSNICALPD